jgi:hypothetical protein
MDAAECRRKIAALNAHEMGEQSEWDAHGREVFNLVGEMADEIDRLRYELQAITCRVGFDTDESIVKRIDKALLHLG